MSVLWRCPRCTGSLTDDGEQLTCVSCAAPYPMFGGIADLRVDLPNWLDIEEDRRRATRLLSLANTLSPRELVAEVFRQRPGWSEADVQYRTEGILGAPDRFTRELEDWMRPATVGTLPFLDLGCGAGPLLVAAARLGRPAVGLDVSLEWLVVARALIVEAGGTPILAAALGEALPLANESVSGVVSLDVIEHVDDQREYLRQIARVLVPGGIAAMATPNRFSLSAEPHVSIWGVGWLPRAWQEGYVRWRGGKSYAHCRLLSLVEIRSMLRASMGAEPHILLGEVPPGEIARFRALKARCAQAYNLLLRVGLARAALVWVCPFFRVLAIKGHP